MVKIWTVSNQFSSQKYKWTKESHYYPILHGCMNVLHTNTRYQNVKKPLDYVGSITIVGGSLTKTKDLWHQREWVKDTRGII